MCQSWFYRLPNSVTLGQLLSLSEPQGFTDDMTIIVAPNMPIYFKGSMRCLKSTYHRAWHIAIGSYDYYYYRSRIHGDSSTAWRI